MIAISSIIRNLKTHLKEYFRYISKQKLAKSSIAEHLRYSNYKINFENAKIILTVDCIYTLYFVENVAIDFHRDVIIKENSDFTVFY